MDSVGSANTRTGNDVKVKRETKNCLTPLISRLFGYLREPLVVGRLVEHFQFITWQQILPTLALIVLGIAIS